MNNLLGVTAWRQRRSGASHMAGIKVPHSRLQNTSGARAAGTSFCDGPWRQTIVMVRLGTGRHQSLVAPSRSGRIKITFWKRLASLEQWKSGLIVTIIRSPAGGEDLKIAATDAGIPAPKKGE